jgi:tetratricopeptide (TPR) repeat protein
MPPHPLAQNALTRRMAGVMLLGGFAIGFAPAKANTSVNERALAAFQAGRWQEAADLAIAIATPDNQAFAARALLAGALLTSNIAARQSSIATAKRFAEAALATTPRHVEARLQLATALGLQARAGSPTRAFARGLPQRVRRILDGVVRDAPGEAWAYALLGGWHLEGLRIGGGAARAMLGCDLAAGKAAFGRAMRLIPSEASTPFYFASSLLALAPVPNALEARALLLRATACPDRDAFQGAVKSRATALSQALDNDGPARAARLALGWL